MNTKVLENSVAQQPTKRLTRQSSKVYSEPTPRGPLKRRVRNKKAGSKMPSASTVVNGSKDDVEEESESASKKRKLEVEGTANGSDDEMDFEDTDRDHKLELHDDQEMSVNEDSPIASEQKCSLDECQMRERTIDHPVVEKCLQSHRTIHSEDQHPDPPKTKPCEPSNKGIVPNKPASQLRQIQTSKRTMSEYRQQMEVKVRSVDPHREIYGTTKASCRSQFRSNNILLEKKTPELQKQDIRKSSVTKQHSGTPYKWSMRQRFCAVFLVLILISLSILAYQSHSKANAGYPAKAVNLSTFEAQLSILEAKFPSQRSELWRRSKIHLVKHLQTAQPREPVSLILTAGRGAERTLHCLAQGLASAFSSTLNGSVLQINGTSKAGQDSDQVKLDIDDQLRAAFEGDKPVAVIHRFEELPPSSTIIFYRYCDHENSAYKRVFLAFTVLLPLDEVGEEHGLKDVEEMVQDYVKSRFVGSEHVDSQTSFNRMDTDKLSGLWSRISHLILPVSAEGKMEQTGCIG